MCAKRGLTGDQGEHLFQAGLICVWEALINWAPARARWVHWVKTYVAFKAMRRYIVDYISPQAGNIVHISLDDDFLDEHPELTLPDVETICMPEPEAAPIDTDGYSETHALMATMLSQGFRKIDVVKELKSRYKLSAAAINIEFETLKEAVCETRTRHSNE